MGSVFGREALYRIGGDEFVVVLEGEAQKGADTLIHTFREAVAQCQNAPGLDPWQRVSAAIGIAACDRAMDASTEDVLKRADAAMYQDKAAMKAERRD